MRLNAPAKRAPAYTHEGARASQLTVYQELRRSVLSCLLWEDTFYESGQSIADRIRLNALAIEPQQLAALAVEARQKFHLRHVPLLLLKCLAETARGIPGLTRNTVEAVISRPDEITELLALYGTKKGLPHGILKGLRQAFGNFDSYQLRKWDRAGAFKLRDAVFITHPAFVDPERQELVANIVNRSHFPARTKGGYMLDMSGTPHLDPPHTWEALIAAAGSDKKTRCAVWTSLLKSNIAGESGGMGYLAILRNLRNFATDEVNGHLINSAIRARRGARRIFPYQYLLAARVAPQHHQALDDALKASIADSAPLSGVTAICADVSGSMQNPISKNSIATRQDAVASIAGCISGDTRLVAFGTGAKEYPPLQGLGVNEVLARASPELGWSTNAHLAVNIVNRMKPTPERIIVITDEQVTQRLPSPISPKAYIINVAPYKNGIGYGDYTQIDGFSQATLDFIRESEAGA